MRSSLLQTALLLLAPSLTSADATRKTCTVKAGGSTTVDDAPAIRTAFQQCANFGKVVFENKQYHVKSVLDIRGLQDVQVDIQGELLWSTDIQYWLKNSLDVGYQNQSTAFILGGNNVHIDGHGKGTLNGNGDTWYEFISHQENQSNFPGRPHALTFNGLTNSTVKGLRFLRSQMWTMSMIYCHHVDLDDIFVNNTGNVVKSFNNDGVDTIRSSFIDFRRWTVYNGDDCISLKANSTDIGIYDSACYDGSGIALGSIGQYKGQYETMERLTVSNVHFGNTLHAVYFKTWTDDQNGYPPNGGGGGLGVCSDMKFTNLTTTNIRNAAVAISQCTQFQGAPGEGNCTNSKFQIKDIEFRGIKGTTLSSRAASMQCSAVAPCTNLGIFDVDVKFANGTEATEYLCGHVVGNKGFNCTGKPCEKPSASGEC